MATWQSDTVATATIELPGDALDVAAWLAFARAPHGRWMTSLKQWACSCCGEAIFPGVRYFYAGDGVNVCPSCMKAKEVL